MIVKIVITPKEPNRGFLVARVEDRKIDLTIIYNEICWRFYAGRRG